MSATTAELKNSWVFHPAQSKRPLAGPSGTSSNAPPMTFAAQHMPAATKTANVALLTVISPFGCNVRRKALAPWDGRCCVNCASVILPESGP